ncbi:MAG TPA: 4Fe-4S cluster-binding domain-containing protein, partial [Epsilonproteobacteria bacterium]|nr:4Fe-4S cluster-binding domain-containing protein [Campylobacterota bacterium]
MNTDSGFSSKSAKPIYDITKFTHLDYPDHLACIIWFAGCNMRCDYCYNKDIVFAKNGTYSLNDALAFLETRRSLLDGVVLSGGEASLQELIPFCKAIKKLGFSIKLDTNGTNPELVKEL